MPIEDLTGRGGGPGRAGPAGLRQRLARGLPLPGDLRRRARHRRRPTSSADGGPCRAGARRAADPRGQRLTVLTKASIVQAEAGSVEDMGKVARVLENRLADGMPLQLDTTVNYANGKTGVTTTAEDRRNPSPYNTYSAPRAAAGRDQQPRRGGAARGARPTPGEWRFFVVVDPRHRRHPVRGDRRGAPAERAAVPAVAAGRTPADEPAEAAVLGRPVGPLALPAAAPGGVRGARADRLDLRRAGHRGRGPAGAAGRSRRGVARASR